MWAYGDAIARTRYSQRQELSAVPVRPLPVPDLVRGTVRPPQEAVRSVFRGPGLQLAVSKPAAVSPGGLFRDGATMAIEGSNRNAALSRPLGGREGGKMHRIDWLTLVWSVWMAFLASVFLYLIFFQA